MLTSLADWAFQSLVLYVTDLSVKMSEKLNLILTPCCSNMSHHLVQFLTAVFDSKQLFCLSTRTLDLLFFLPPLDTA